LPSLKARYEFKYLVTPDQEAFIRQVAQMYCEPDPYGENGKYAVTSLYFDTWDWLTAMQTVEGQRNRFKLRIRTYGFTDADPVFLENKGRVGTSILKQRALMDRKYVRAICRNEPPPPGGFPPLKEGHRDDLIKFRDRMDLLDMRPRLWVAYQREAYGSMFGDGARLTFDTELQIQPPDTDDPFVPDDRIWQTVELDGPQTIVEMKFNGAFPFWMQRIVHGLELKRVSCSKYVQGAEQLGDVPWNRVEWGGAWTVY
jgi:SPX domain protein involved in polyphosphate accumulation